MPVVCYDLKQTPYVVKVGDYEFYFSTEKWMKKFESSYQEKIEYVQQSLIKRFQINFNFYKIGIIWAYKKCESNGFLIKYKGRLYQAEDIIGLD